MIPGKAAANTHRLRVGDRILSVNGMDVTKASHTDAVTALKEAIGELVLEVKHEPLPKGYQVSHTFKFKRKKTVHKVVLAAMIFYVKSGIY